MTYIGDGTNLNKKKKSLSYTAAKNLPGLAVFIDFEKAFDSIECNFLFKVLDKLNFGPDLIQKLKTNFLLQYN